MKIRSLIFFIPILLIELFNSCNLFNMDYYDEQLNLSRMKDSVTDSLWGEFPEKIDSSTRVISTYNPAVLKNVLNYYGISIKQSLSPEDFRTKINFFKEKSIFQKSLQEIKKQNNESVFLFDIKKNYNNDSISNEIKYIIPSYKCQYNFFNGLVNDSSQLIVLNSEFGIFNDNEYLEYSKTFSRHGFSKGLYYDTNKFEIFYWLILW